MKSGAGLDQRGDGGGESLRAGAVDGAAVFHFGEAGIGLDPQGQRGGGAQAAANGDVLGDAHAAVGAYAMGPSFGPFGGRPAREWRRSWCDPCSGRCRRRKRPPRQAGRERGLQRQGGFGGIAEGFEQQRIGPAIGQRLSLLSEGFEDLFGPDFAGGQQLAGGADGGEHQRAPGGGLHASRESLAPARLIAVASAARP